MNTKPTHMPTKEQIPPIEIQIELGGKLYWINLESLVVFRTEDSPDAQAFTPVGNVVTEANAEFIVRAVNSHEALLGFAKKHHEVCEDCEGTGKIYKHADPTTMQWVPCSVAEILHLDGAVRGGE